MMDYPTFFDKREFFFFFSRAAVPLMREKSQPLNKPAGSPDHKNLRAP